LRLFSWRRNIGSLTRGVLQDPDSPRPCRTSALPHACQTISDLSFSTRLGSLPVSGSFVTKTEQDFRRRLRNLELQQGCRIEIDALPAHREMQMRASGTPAAATKAYDLVRLNLVALFSSEF